MELATNDSPSNAPKSYPLEMSKDFIPMCAFSETTQGRVSVEGKVLNKFDMKPHFENIGDYGKLCRERTKKSMAKTRQLKVIENDHGEYMIPKPAMGDSLLSSSKDKNKKMPMRKQQAGSDGGGMRKIRMERGELEVILFKLFETQPNWSIRQLILETHQPEQFVRDIVKDICVYNKRGKNQGTYELKLEYKQQAGSIVEEEPVPNSD
ncbi:Transcription initiation factor IIF [Macleaya cordata]|uniref:Transcription initiation factor IIF n=1 Tax=Macleaya cordata TaxID=56857 RepID=A0A200R5X2_MACCD|nr:Transcription initiation factor IIF [Macleaya cordata]